MPRNPFRQTEGVAAHRLSAPRLFAIVLAFVALSGYMIWKSDRFQNLFLGVSQARLSAALKRPVSFRTADFRIFPPSVRLQDVVIGNDPRAGDRPLLFVEEVSVGGGISLVGSLVAAGSHHNQVSTILGFVAVVCASINVVGGFMITDRMLKMFKRHERK